MSRVCELTGRRPVTGNNVSHSNIKTRTRWVPNLKTKKFFIPELKDTVNVVLSARAIKTVDKHGGLTQAIFEAREEDLSQKLQKLKRTVKKVRRS